MNLELSPAAASERIEVSHLLQLHLAELARFGGRRKRAGRYPYRWFDTYWDDPLRYPYLLRVDDETAGFVFVRGHPDTPYGEWDWEIAEFFVRTRFRRQGLGREAIRILRGWHPRVWSVPFHRRNAAARAFWIAVAHEIAGPHVRPTPLGRRRERIVISEPFRGQLAA